MLTDDRVLHLRMKEGAAGYGCYILMMQHLSETPKRAAAGQLNQLSWALHLTDVELLRRVIFDYGLFDIAEDGLIRCPWLDTALRPYDERARVARESGLRGAQKRWQDADGGRSPEVPAPRTPECNSKVLQYSYKDITGERMLSVCRNPGMLLTQEDERQLREANTQINHYSSVASFCVTRKLGIAVCYLLIQLTDNALVGSDGMRRLIAIDKHLTETKYAPSHMAEYIVCKMLDGSTL